MIRMKNKTLSKIHLDRSGQMVIKAVPATSDSPSKGVSAQPGNPLSEIENKGNRGPMPHEVTVNANEPSTGGPATRVAPDTLVEVASNQAAPAPHEKVPAAVTPNVIEQPEVVTEDIVSETEVTSVVSEISSTEDASDTLPAETPAPAPQAPKVEDGQEVL